MQNEKHKIKYFKYKSKYLHLKNTIKLKGGENMPKNPSDMLSFIKNITMENINIRFSTKPDYEDLITRTKNLTNILEIAENMVIFEKVFTKGYDRLFRLQEYMMRNEIYNSKNNNAKALIVAQFIIINQVFGDGNHRTALYVLNKYSSYSQAEKEIIMKITEDIHRYDGDLKYLWSGIDGNFFPNYEKLMENKYMNELLKK